MLHEGLKQNSTIVIVPSSAVETMQLGGLAALIALAMGIGQEQTIKEAGTPRSESAEAPAPDEAASNPLMTVKPPLIRLGCINRLQKENL
jgi:hypothetical protein